MHINPEQLPKELYLSGKAAQRIIDTKVSAMLRYFAESGFGKAVIGLSGGIDSAVSAALAVRALGAENVICVRLPCGERGDSYFRAAEIAESLGIPKQNLLTVDITNIVNAITEDEGIALYTTDKQELLRIGNFAARMRMTRLMDKCTKLGALLVGTENLTEHHMAYFTIGGDAVSNYEPFVGNLWKVQIFQLAAALEQPESVLNCPPSAELWAGQTDEDEMGASYMAIDIVLHRYVQQEIKFYTPGLMQYGVTEEMFNTVIARYHRMMGKANAPYVSP